MIEFDNSPGNIRRLIKIGQENKCGFVLNRGSWDGSGKSRDIYADILTAMTYLDQIRPSFLVLNERNREFLNHMNSERITFWKQIGFLFETEFPCRIYPDDFIIVDKLIPENRAMLYAKDDCEIEHVVLIDTA